MTIHLHIDELVLHGLDVRDPQLLREAVAGELSQLLATQGNRPAWNKNSNIARIDGGSFELSRRDPGATQLGGQIARQVAGGLNK